METPKDSVAKLSLLNEFKRIYEGIITSRFRLMLAVKYYESDVTLTDSETEIGVNKRTISITSACINLKSYMKTLSNLYPSITSDRNFLYVQECLQNYEIKRQGFFASGYRWNTDVLEDIAVHLDPIRSKISLMRASISALENELFVSENLKPEEIFKSLIASKKSTEPARILIGELKENIADKELWKNYRTTLKKLIPELRSVGMPQHWKHAQTILINYNERYDTDSKLYEEDIQRLLNFSNDVIDKLEPYDIEM